MTKLLLSDLCRTVFLFTPAMPPTLKNRFQRIREGTSWTHIYSSLEPNIAGGGVEAGWMQIFGSKICWSQSISIYRMSTWLHLSRVVAKKSNSSTFLLFAFFPQSMTFKLLWRVANPATSFTHGFMWMTLKWSSHLLKFDTLIIIQML